MSVVEKIKKENQSTIIEPKKSQKQEDENKYEECLSCQ